MQPLFAADPASIAALYATHVQTNHASIATPIAYAAAQDADTAPQESLYNPTPGYLLQHLLQEIYC